MAFIMRPMIFLMGLTSKVLSGILWGMATKPKHKEHPGVARAIQKAGGQKALADLLGCGQSGISKRLNCRLQVTAEWAVMVEKALKGGVTRRELRPDLFG
jgi:Putative antitoxin of bacterial toxin-antitoxin system, YdaS/YdaT